MGEPRLTNAADQRCLAIDSLEIQTNEPVSAPVGKLAGASRAPIQLAEHSVGPTFVKCKGRWWVDSPPTAVMIAILSQELPFRRVNFRCRNPVRSGS